MPRLNKYGDIVAGVDGQVSVNNVRIDDGYMASWLDDTHVIYQRQSDNALIVYNGSTLAPIPGGERGGNALAAGGGQWAAWLAGVGVYNAGWASSPAGLAGVGTDNRGSTTPDGLIACVPDRQIGFGLELRQANGAIVLSLPGVAVRSCHPWSVDAIVWIQNGVLQVHGFPEPFPQPEVVSAVRMAESDGTRVLLLTLNDRLILRHWDSLQGVVVVPGPFGFAADVVALDDGVLRVAWSLGVGERPGEQQSHDYTLADLVHDTSPVPPEPIPPDPIPPDPVPPDPVPPDPEPEPVPPSSAFPAATEVVHMEACSVALRNGEMFARIDPHVTTEPYHFFSVFFDRPDASDPNTHFTLSQPNPSDARLYLRHNVSGAYLGADATHFSPSIAEQFYGKQSDPQGYELWNGWQLGSSGIDIVLIQYDRDGAKYVSCGLTVVPL